MYLLFQSTKSELENDKEEDEVEDIQIETKVVRSIRRGCQINSSDDRALLQVERARININLARQMKILTGAENLYRATGNCKVKETVALELNFVEASVDLLKEELIELNGTLKVRTIKSGAIFSPPKYNLIFQGISIQF